MKALAIGHALVCEVESLWDDRYGISPHTRDRTPYDWEMDEDRTSDEDLAINDVAGAVLDRLGMRLITGSR
jgi:hypothetical protein